MEVYPGIHQLSVPIPNNPLGEVNAYLVKSKGECLLIDTGWNTDEAFGSLARQLSEADVAFGDLNYIAITHVHSDHYGLAGRVKKHSHAELIMHEIERSFVDSRYVHYENLLVEMDQWLRINGVPDSERSKLVHASMAVISLVWVVMPERVVRGGEHLTIGDFDFEVVWTPGHSPGHICFYDASRNLLISGDHLLAGITPNVSLHTQSMGNPLADYLDSLQAVEQLPVHLVLPGHRNTFHDVPRRSEEIREHHEHRKQRIVDAVSGERLTAYQIASLLPWSTNGVPWADLPPSPKRATITETLAHLESLRAEGKIGKTLMGGVAWYGRKR